MFWWIFLAIVGTLAAGGTLSVAGSYFWKKFDLRSKLADWLHEHNLKKSQLMNVLIKVDDYFCRILRLFITRKNSYSTPELVTVVYLDRDQLPSNILQEMYRVQREKGEYQEIILQN